MVTSLLITDDAVGVHGVGDGRFWTGGRLVDQTETDRRRRPLELLVRMLRILADDRRRRVRIRPAEPAPLVTLRPLTATDAVHEPVERRRMSRRRSHHLVFQGERRRMPEFERAAAHIRLVIIVDSAGRQRHDAGAALHPAQFAQPFLLLDAFLRSQQVAEDVEEEDDRHRVQISEKSLLVIKQINSNHSSIDLIAAILYVKFVFWMNNFV